MSNGAIVSFSGGQDSTTCLFWALKHYDHVETVGFNYGQKNAVELNCRQAVLEKIQTQFPDLSHKLGGDLVIDATTFGQVSTSALTGSGKPIQAHGRDGLPTSFVPARNLMFMTYVGARAYLREIHTIITCELGGEKLVDFIVRETHTCYEGDHEHLHPWGYGCGKCPACVLRKKGYEEFLASKE
mgnify:CR=1 FL=1